MKKIALILGLVLAFGAAPALAQNNQDPRIGAGTPHGTHGTQHGTQPGVHRGNRHIERGATAPVPESDEEVATTEATPGSNTDYAPWDNHLNAEIPVISIE